MNLAAECMDIRRRIFKAAYKGGEAHLGGMFSCVEILASLYLGGVVEIDVKNPYCESRDRFILSKGHCALALYAVLNKIGAITDTVLYSFIQNGSKLGTHPKFGEIPFVEATTGSLGHGLSYSIGLAIAYKKLGFKNRIYCLLGDGECQEGSVWEAALSAPALGLDNLTVIIDYNKLQAMDRLESIVGIEPFTDKWRAFNWDVYEIDGHNCEQIISVLNTDTKGAPKLIIANTVKGKGVSFMESMPLWHVRMPNTDELVILLKELKMSYEELTL